MKRENLMNNHIHITNSLSQLPRKMLNLHGLDNITEFVLHELCGKDCFNLTKAAYFVDNPDFNCLKGVVGISYAELDGITDSWQDPQHFSQKMLDSPFHKKVRSLLKESHKRNGKLDENTVGEIATDLNFNTYDFYAWDMKHNNHGFLICEKDTNNDSDQLHKDIIINGLSLLSFCPIH